MSDLAPVGHLGPATEALLARSFAECLELPACRVARLLGMDEKTLRAKNRDGLIGRVGATRYTEADLRLYLSRESLPAAKKEAEPCPSTNRPKAASGSTTSSFAARAITARPGKLRDAPPRRRKPGSASKSPKERTARKSG